MTCMFIYNLYTSTRIAEYLKPAGKHNSEHSLYCELTHRMDGTGRDGRVYSITERVNLGDKGHRTRRDEDYVSSEISDRKHNHGAERK